MPIPPSVLPGGTGFGGGIFGVVPTPAPPTAPGTYNYGVIFALTIYRGAVTPDVIPEGVLIAVTNYRAAITNFTRVEELGLHEY